MIQKDKISIFLLPAGLGVWRVILRFYEKILIELFCCKY